jgi:hypothetical protein
MASVEKIKAAIAQIAQRRKNTTLSEIEWVINQLGEQGHPVRSRSTTHGVLYAVGSARFSVCVHNPGSKQVKACYVDGFLDAMIEIGMYGE